jgi:hypothetical protein
MMADQHKKEKGELENGRHHDQDGARHRAADHRGPHRRAAFSNSKFIAEELVLTPRVAREVYGAHFESREWPDRRL